MKKIILISCFMLSVVSMPSFSSVENTQEKVFLDYTKEQLDHNYDQVAWAPNIKQILDRYDFKSQQTIARLGEPEKYSTGAGDVEGVTFYRAKNSNAPVQIFIHGGAWRAGSASSYLYPAEMFLDNGISYAVLDFNNVQDVGLDGMVEQIRSSIVWIYNNSEKLGINKERIYITGHSSGAHLGGVVLTTDWKEYGLSSDVIKGATLLSGMYDLKAVRLSDRSSYVPFTDEIEDTMSIQRHLDKIKGDIVLAYGGFETHEFQRQTREFYQVMNSSGKDVDLIKFDYSNHFEILDNYDNPYNPLVRSTMKMMNH